MKRGASCTVDKQNGNLMNGNYHHHLEAKNCEAIGLKERLCWKFIFFFYGQDTGYFEFIPEGKAVSIDVLCRLGDAVRRKRPKN